MPGHDERASARVREVHVVALHGQELASALERGAHPIPHTDVGAREMPAPDALCTEGRHHVSAGEAQQAPVHGDAGCHSADRDEIPLSVAEEQ